MASNNIARLGVVLGLDTAEFTASIDKAIQENKKLGQAIKRDTNAAAGEIIALKNATDDYGKTLTKVQLIEREISQGKFRSATDEMKNQLLAQAAAYDKVAAGANKAAGGLTAWQKQGLMYQTTDFFTQIASGQSVMIAAIQQGGQLKDQMGGLGNMFRVLGPIVFSVTGGMIAVGAAIGAAAFGAYQGRKEFDALTNSIILTGNYSKVTVDEFGVMATTIASTSRASIGDAKEILNSMIGSGQFTNKTFDSVSKTIQKFSELSGLTASEAAAKLIPALDGTASSARKLNDQYNFLTLEQYKHIEALDKQGKRQESIIYTSDLLNESFNKTKIELGYLDQALDASTKFWGNFWAAVKDIGKPDTIPEQIRKIQEQINLVTAKGAPKARPLLGDKDKNVKAYADELSRLEEQKKKLIATLVSAEEESARMEGQKGAIKKYGESGGVDAALVRQKNVNDAMRALDYANRMAVADDEEKIYLESSKTREDMYANYLFDIATKDKDFQSQRRQIYLAEFDIEALSYLTKIDDFNQKRINKAVDAAQAERFARQKVADEETGKILERQGVYTNILDASIATANAEKDKLEAQIKTVGMSEKQVKLAEIEAKYQEQITKNLLEANGNEMALKAWNDKAEAMKNAAQMNVELADSLKNLQAVNDIVWTNMTDAIDNFVNAGGKSFEDFIRNAIKQMMMFYAKQQMLGLFGIGKSLFAGAGIGSVGNAATMAPGGGYFADGGDPPVGVPSMVGERGPELFVPKTAGTIIPNHMLGSNDTGPTINYNGPYIANMSAIDTQSGVQFLAKNKQAVWATYQSANRSVPMSR